MPPKPSAPSSVQREEPRHQELQERIPRGNQLDGRPSGGTSNVIQSPVTSAATSTSTVGTLDSSDSSSASMERRVMELNRVRSQLFRDSLHRNIAHAQGDTTALDQERSVSAATAPGESSRTVMPELSLHQGSALPRTTVGRLRGKPPSAAPPAAFGSPPRRRFSASTQSESTTNIGEDKVHSKVSFASSGGGRTRGDRDRHPSCDEGGSPPAHLSSISRPEGRFRCVWNVLLFVIYLYVATFSVFIISFLGVLDVKSGWFWVERVIDLLFLSDILLSLHTPHALALYRDEHVPSKIRKHYLCGWCIVDFLSSLPWDVVPLVLGKDVGKPHVLQLPRFFRLLRVPKAFALLRPLERDSFVTSLRVKLGITRRHLHLARLCLTACLLSHWVGCLFYFFGVISNADESNPDSSWLFQDAVPDDRFGKYVMALYFGIKTVTTIGYGDVIPRNTVERCYTVFAMLIGAAFFGYLISQIHSMVKENKAASEEYRKDDDKVMEMARVYGFPSKLTVDVLRHVRERHYAPLCKRDMTWLDDLTPDLKQIAVDHYWPSWSTRSELLRDATKAIPEDVRALNSKLKFAVYAPGETVFKAGDRCEEFYYIRSGSVKVIGSQCDFETLNEGMTFGEEEILFGSCRRSRAECETQTKLIVVPRDAVEQVLDKAPTVRKNLERAHAQKLWDGVIRRTQWEQQTLAFARRLRDHAQSLKPVMTGGTGEHHREEDETPGTTSVASTALRSEQ